MNTSLAKLCQSKPLLEKLNATSLFTFQDIVTKSPLELVKTLNVSLSAVEDLLNQILSTKIEPIDALTLSKQNDLIEKNNTDKFDEFLNENQLFKRGILSEICGPPGVGKTQFLFKICSNYLFNPNNQNKSIIYIDTENNFNIKRLIEIGRFKYALNNRSEEELINMTKNIYIYKIFSLEEFNNKMEELELEILKNNTHLIIIDSIASLVRREFSGNNSSVFHDRAVFLSKTSTYLKKIAELLEISIVVTNQIVTCTGNELNDSETNDGASVIPSLGSSWTHYVNIRFILQFINDETRELLVAKSPVIPFRKYIYYIDKTNGLTFENDYQTYEGANPSFQNIKIKPYFN